jgi:uncharacterized protein
VDPSASARRVLHPRLCPGWFGWPLYAAGVLFPEPIFFAIGPLLAALIVIGVAEGRAGFRDLGARMVRWRVAWYWYLVALGLPLAVRFIGVALNIGLGGADGFTFLRARVVQLRRSVRAPADQPDGRCPRRGTGWRGFALPRMQATRSPLYAAVVLGVLVAGWHLPLVVMGDGDLASIGLLSTFAITIVYVWLFNHTRGSVLLTLIFHATQGSTPLGELGIQGRTPAALVVGRSTRAIATEINGRRAWPSAWHGSSHEILMSPEIVGATEGKRVDKVAGRGHRR